jgi:hypothetical protein
MTKTSRYIIVVWEQVKERPWTVRVKTAYDYRDRAGGELMRANQWGPVSPQPKVKRVYDRDDLSPDGNGDEVVTQGMWMALMNLVTTLKARREEMGLTIAEVVRRSRLTVVTLSRLENFHNRNPSLDTVFRYAMALNFNVTLDLEAIEPDEEDEPAAR